jgi:hypothetical protein
MATREKIQATAAARVARPVKDDLDYESITERTARIEHKVVVAQLVLERLSPLDARSRLLASAVLRRDEVLLDAILAQLSDVVATLSQPPRSATRRA